MEGWEMRSSRLQGRAFEGSDSWIQRPDQKWSDSPNYLYYQKHRIKKVPTMPRLSMEKKPSTVLVWPAEPFDTWAARLVPAPRPN